MTDVEQGIYLAGPIANDDDPRTWRDTVKERYPTLNFIDPMDWQDAGIWDADPLAVWERELAICRENPVLVCNLGSDATRTSGTHHEIRVALDAGQPVAIVPSGAIWEIYELGEAEICESIAEAIEALVGPFVTTDGGRPE